MIDTVNKSLFITRPTYSLVCKRKRYIVPNVKIQYMIDYVTSVNIDCIMKDQGLTAEEAMKAFYNSQVFNRLCDVETGLYRESGGYVYDLYKIEREYGRLVQLEQ